MPEATNIRHQSIEIKLNFLLGNVLGELSQ